MMFHRFSDWLQTDYPKKDLGRILFQLLMKRMYLGKHVLSLIMLPFFGCVCCLVSVLFVGSNAAHASEWFVQDDVIGAPPGAGFDQGNNLYYYSGLFSELRVRTPSGVLINQIALTQPPFSTTGFSAFNLDIRDMAVAPDGATYMLIADNQGLSNTTVKLVGLLADHTTVAPLQLTWFNLTSVRPTRIAVDADGNVFVLEVDFLVFNMK